MGAFPRGKGNSELPFLRKLDRLQMLLKKEMTFTMGRFHVVFNACAIAQIVVRKRRSDRFNIQSSLSICANSPVKLPIA